MNVYLGGSCCFFSALNSFDLFSQIVLYLRMCLAYSAGVTPLSSRLADMQDDAPAIGRYVQALLCSEHQPSVSKGSESNPIHVYMDLLQQLLSAVGGETLHLLHRAGLLQAPVRFPLLV